jgi:ElaB/YqjD/DUF883 family membrane-anchored ribosome-binding protein
VVNRNGSSGLNRNPSKENDMLFSKNTRRALGNDMEQLRADVADLAESVRGMANRNARLSSYFSLPSRRDSWGDQAYDRFAEARNLAGQGADVATQHLQHAMSAASREIRQRPATALLVILGVGLLAGMLHRQN